MSIFEMYTEEEIRSTLRAIRKYVEAKTYEVEHKDDV